MGGPERMAGKATRWPERTFVGREDLLAELSTAARNAVAGAGSVVLLTGEAGIGKTSLARAVARELRDELDVHWGNCTADKSAPPYWPWRGLLDIADATQIADAPGNAAANVDDMLDPATIGTERYEHLTTLREQLERRRDPLLVVLEDLQWADVASVLLLAHVSVTIASSACMVLATLRTGEPLSPQLDGAMDELRRRTSVRAVPALTDDAIDALMRDAGVAPDHELTSLLRERTGGNPLYVTELLRATRPAGLRGGDLRDIIAGSVPERVAELIAMRLERLPDAVADVVGTASVVGMHGDVRTLARIQGADLEAIVDLLEQARAARLLDAAPPGRWQFGHDLVRDAIYASLGDGVRARRHAAVVDGLTAAGAPPPAMLAHHALAAQPLFDPERAVALAAQAGELAFAQHAYEEAVVWFERALTAAPDGIAPRWRMELLVARGEAHRHLGELDAARRAFVDAADLAAEAGDPALLARAALGYADPGADLGIAYRTDDPATRELLERAIAAQPDDASVTTVLLETRLAAELYFSDDPGRARELIDTALARSRQIDDQRAHAAAAAVFHDAFVVGQAELAAQLAGSEQLLQRAHTTGSAGARLAAHRARVFDLLAAGDLTAMDSEILAFRRLAEPLRAPGYLWWPALWSAMRTLLEGRHELAEQRALEAFALGEGPFPSLAFINLSFLLFFLRREQGRFAEMEQGTREYASTYADVPALRVGLTFLLAELGRVDEARGLLDAVSDGELRRLHDRNWPASWFQLARAAAIVGDRRMAAALLDASNVPTVRCVTVSLATVCLGSADLARAWLLETVGDLDAADGCYRTAEEVNARIGARSWLAQARADHARLLLDRGRDDDVEEARRLALMAAEAAADIGLPLVRAQAAEIEQRLSKRADGETAPPPRFRRAGNVWNLDFADRTVQLAHTRGLSDVAFLLARPNQAVSVLELSGDRPGVAGAARGELALDERARREIRDRLHEIDAEVAEAEANNDTERASAALEQRQRLAEAVARDLGLGGRSRRVDDPLERARKTVSTRIRRTIASIGKAHPELGRHLERSIDTGAWCAYRPSEPVSWQL